MSTAVNMGKSIEKVTGARTDTMTPHALLNQRDVLRALLSFITKKWARYVSIWHNLPMVVKNRFLPSIS